MNRTLTGFARLRTRLGLLLALFAFVCVSFAPSIHLNTSTTSNPAVSLTKVTFRQTAQSPLLSQTGARAVTVADFNHDGRPDAAVLNTLFGTVETWIGDGKGGFLHPAAALIATGPRPAALRAEDFNHDGNSDLAVMDQAAGDVRIFLGDGTGNLNLTTVLPLAQPAEQALVTTGDFNLDGHPDLVVAGHTGQATLWFGNKAGDLVIETSSTFNLGGDLGGLVRGDFNRDGKTDLATVNPTATELRIFAGTGQGGFLPLGTHSLSAGPRMNPQSLVTNDFNLDGILDFLLLSSSAGTAILWSGDAKGNFSPAEITLTQVGQSVELLSSGDFNLDGKPDVIALNPQTASAVVLLNNAVVGVPPTLRTASGIVRKQGSVGAIDAIALVFDTETDNGALVFSIPNTPTGLSITDIVNNAGTVSAMITASCAAQPGEYFIPVRVADGDGNTTGGNLFVVIEPNALAKVGPYPSVTTTLGNPISVFPNVPLSDNGTIATVSVAASSGFEGDLAVNATNGVVMVNPTVLGIFTITVTAVDNCGLSSTASFSLGSTPLQKGPFISAISPNVGLIGSRVVITGSNLDRISVVSFNGGTTRQFTVDSPTQLTVTVPPTASTGQISVAGPNGLAVGQTFTVIRRK